MCESPAYTAGSMNMKDEPDFSAVAFSMNSLISNVHISHTTSCQVNVQTIVRINPCINKFDSHAVQYSHIDHRIDIDMFCSCI